MLNTTTKQWLFKKRKSQEISFNLKHVALFNLHSQYKNFNKEHKILCKITKISK